MKVNGEIVLLEWSKDTGGAWIGVSPYIDVSVSNILWIAFVVWLGTFEWSMI